MRPQVVVPLSPGDGTGSGLVVLLAPEKPLQPATHALRRLADRLPAFLPQRTYASHHPAEIDPENPRHRERQSRREDLIDGELGIVNVTIEDKIHRDLVVIVQQVGQHGPTGKAHESAHRALGRDELEVRDRGFPGRFQLLIAH